MGSNELIKIVEPADQAGIRLFLNNAGSSLRSFRYFEKRPLDVIKNHLVTCLLFDGDSDPVGYGHLDQEGTDIYLGIAVIEKRRGEGLGSMIIKYLLSEAKQKGIETIKLTVDDENEVARRMYERFGFRVVGRSKGLSSLMELSF